MTNPKDRSQATKLALVIAHDPSGGAGMIGARLIERGYSLDEHIVCADLLRPDLAAPFPINLDDYDLLVVMGSSWSVYDTGLIGQWIHDELKLLRDAHALDLPILGVCFGGQALAAALGGSVAPAPHTEIGWFDIEPVRSPAIVDEVPSTFPISTGPWFQWHHDQFCAPPDSTLLATSSAGHQLFLSGRTVGTQFHPEVDPPHLEGFLADTTDEYLNEYGTLRDDLVKLTNVNHERARAQCNEFVDWFLTITDR